MKISTICLTTIAAGLTAFGSGFTQCPAVDVDTSGCELLVTVLAVNGSGAATSWTVSTSSPDLGPFDGSDDTLIGIVNSSTAVLHSITFNTTSTNAQVFGFDGDGACSGGYSPEPTLAQCGLTAYTSTDPMDYESAGATFSAISPDSNIGTVNVGGTAGLAVGVSTWFDLEGTITSNIISAPPGSTTPEPGSLALLGGGLVGLGYFARRASVRRHS